MALLLLLTAGRAALAQPDGIAALEAASQAIHRFDFLEPENLDPLPKYWVRFPDPSFPDYPDPAMPRFTEAFRDSDQGHEAPPAFRLSAKGRNVAFRYTGRETRITPGDYIISGWIKPDGLIHARACLSAYYLDWDGQPLVGTQRFSALIGSPGGTEAAAAPPPADAWQRVQVQLPAAPPQAIAVGLTCWVVQQEVWREGSMPRRKVPYRDAQGGAWFDDLSVQRIPRVELRSAQAGNIVQLPQAPRLLTTVCDQYAERMEAWLTIRDQAGVEVQQTAVPVHRIEEAQAVETTLRPLAPGLYHAELVVSARAQRVLEQELTFAVVGPTHRRPVSVAGHWGVIVEEAAGGESSDTADLLGLVAGLGVGAVKLPLWTDDPTRAGYETYPQALDHVLDGLSQARVMVVGVLGGPPAALVSATGPHARSLVDILSESTASWQDHLVAVAAPYASVFRCWQVGRDGDADVSADQRLGAVLNSVRTAMSAVVTAPELAAVASGMDWPGGERLPAENLSLELPPEVLPGFVAEQLRPHLEQGYARVWVGVERPPAEARSGSPTLASWALRLIEARHAGADVVFVPQLWQRRDVLFGQVTEPTEAYLVYHTLVDTLGDAVPVEPLDLGAEARALVFSGDNEAVLVMWDAHAPPEGRPYVVQLGQEIRAVDLTGHPVPLGTSADGQTVVTLGSAPLIVTGVEKWLMDFRASLHLTPRKVDFTIERRRHVLAVNNPHQQPVSGEIALEMPAGWEVEPRILRFSLQAGDQREFELDVRYGRSETAGLKGVRAVVQLTSNPPYRMEATLPVEIGLSDVDVRGHATVSGKRVVVYQAVTNRSDRPLSFRGFAVYPGRSRQYRVLNDILPGQTQSTEYFFNNAVDASGQAIRLGLREVDGARIHNLEVVVP